MKRNRIPKALLAITLTAVLCFGGGTAALAAGEPIYGTEDAPAQAAITKSLVMPEGNTIPTAEFAFEITKVSLDGNTDSDSLAIMPNLTADILSFAEDSASVTSGNLTIATLETGNLFEGAEWPHAGVYIYTITEVADTYTPASNETMSYSVGEYQLVVYVANGANNTVYISAVSAIVVTPDNASQAVGDKVDPTPGSGGLVFTNTFSTYSSGLDITKTVTGEYADLTKYFAFELTVYSTVIAEEGTTYPVYVRDESGNVSTLSLNAPGQTIIDPELSPSYFLVTAGETITIYLRDGQTLYFETLEVGTTYEITEMVVADYTTTIELVVDGGDPIQITGDDPSTPIGTGERLIGEDSNWVEFTNRYQDITPTGIALDMLPYVIMIVLAAGAVTVFVIVKLRKRLSARKN